MLVLYVFILFQAVLGEKVIYNIEDAETLFESFVISYEKVYMNEAEKNERFEIFKNNLIKVIELNEMYPTTSYVINEFTDLTSEEFIKTHTGHVAEDASDLCRVLTDADLTPGNAPATYDLRDKIKIQVKNQKTCFSCWAFAATGSVEAAYHLKYNSFVSLSEQQLVDCVGKSCKEGGNPCQAIRYLIDAGGQEPDSVYPYVDAFQTCQFDVNKVQAKVADCVSFQLQNEDLIKEALYTYGALFAAIDSSTWQQYGGGIIKNCEQGPPDHAVLIIGYGTNDEGDYWIVKNSWGAGWGMQGYILLPRGQNACSIVNQDLGAPIVA